jgi:hypothetical protein
LLVSADVTSHAIAFAGPATTHITTSTWRSPVAAPVAVAAFAVIALNLLDAFCTLRHIAFGAVEMNPLMRVLLELGPIPFLVGKHALAALGVLGIVAHARHRAARQMLRLVLVPVYFAIGTYQVLLFTMV